MGPGPVFLLQKETPVDAGDLATSGTIHREEDDPESDSQRSPVSDTSSNEDW